MNQSFIATATYQPKSGSERRPLSASLVLDSTTSSPLTRSVNLTPLTIERPQTETAGSTDSSPTPAISPGLGSRVLGPCAECGLRITNIADACHAMGYLYHNSCFVCSYCQRTLRGKTFYKDQDKIYCEEDYLYCGFQQAAEKCAVCGHLISETILQAMGNSYHPGCFKCCICNQCLDSVPFTVDSNNLIFCVHDYHLVHSPRCGACGLVIMPENNSDEIVRVVAMDKEFHIGCYRCADCKRPLGDEPENRCYPKTEPDPFSPDKRVQYLLCLSCHLSRIGAVPATTASPVSPSPKPLGGSSNRGSPLLRFYPLSNKI
ncbi:unnamed protein product [Calicophoron daubneyi]|uniref:LIM zinc-binding domain-containing protein n=1 Tax=Calicophoron daubneyi TaxID=300641 RepID=A0AAV2TXI6_CALDB